MKNLMLIVAVLVGAIVVSSSSANADHRRFGGCNSGWSGYGGGISYYSAPSYSYEPSYSYVPSYSYGYSSYSAPSSGIYYSRPGLSISIGRSYGFGGYGGGYSGHHDHHYHH